MRPFFFGAGSSYGTLEHCVARPPLAKCFGASLSKQPGFPAKYTNLASAADYLGKKLSEIGLEDLWTCLDYSWKLSGADGALENRPEWLEPAVRELRTQALLWLYGKRCDSAADLLPDSEEYTLGKLLKNQIKEGDVIISFNYDTLVERLTRRFGLNLRHCSGAPCTFVKFVKPHGSASWRLISPPAVVDCTPLFDALGEDEDNDPLVLGTVPIKSELIREVQFHYGACDVFRVVMHQWRGVVEAIRDADELVVVGYGFPKEDQYGRFLFKEGQRLRKTKPIQKIEYYNTTAESGASILEVFGGEGTEIVWRGPVLGAKLGHVQVP